MPSSGTGPVIRRPYPSNPASIASLKNPNRSASANRLKGSESNVQGSKVKIQKPEAGTSYETPPDKTVNRRTAEHSTAEFPRAVSLGSAFFMKIDKIHSIDIRNSLFNIRYSFL
jgi:hypothetical protein